MLQGRAQLHAVLGAGLFCLLALAAGAAQAAAKRVIALAPSLTELVYAAGAGQTLVGVSAFSDYPPEAKRHPVVADFAGVNLEAVLALKPDLVLAWPGGTKASDVERLKSLGITVLEVGISQLEDVPHALQRVGSLLGTDASAQKAAAAFSQRLRALRQRSKSGTHPRVFIEIGRTPLLTVNDQHAIAGIVRICGGINVFADAPQLIVEPSREALLAKNPQMLVYGQSEKSRLSSRDDSLYQGTDAYAARRFVGVHADHLLRPGPRMIDAAEALCQYMSEFEKR